MEKKKCNCKTIKGVGKAHTYTCVFGPRYISWGLFGRDGTFIAAFRFKPKRVYEGKKGSGYFAWTDCNGPRYDSDPKKYGRGQHYAENTIEGSAGAVCKKIKTPAPL